MPKATDAIILRTFPFESFQPQNILFEYKHADGVHHLGENFTRLVTLLNENLYRVRIIDSENCLAKLPSDHETNEVVFDLYDAVVKPQLHPLNRFLPQPFLPFARFVYGIFFRKKRDGLR
jgi:hypothetical protein